MFVHQTNAFYLHVSQRHQLCNGLNHGPIWKVKFTNLSLTFVENVIGQGEMKCASFRT